jgi:hypothetical protein
MPAMAGSRVSVDPFASRAAGLPISRARRQAEVMGSTRRGAYVSQPLQPGHCQ